MDKLIQTLMFRRKKMWWGDLADIEDADKQVGASVEVMNPDLDEESAWKTDLDEENGYMEEPVPPIVQQIQTDNSEKVRCKSKLRKKP